MKTFKGLFIDNGIIKAGEFPVEPKYFHYYGDKDKMDAYFNQVLKKQYEQALATAKANAVECEDQDGAGKMIGVKAPYAGNNFIFPLPSGWDYMVVKKCANCERLNCESMLCRDPHDGLMSYIQVAALYRTEEETDAVKHAFNKWYNTQGWDQWDYELQQFSAEFVMEFAEQYAAFRISELEAENKRLREALIDAKEDAAALIEQHRWIPVTERLPEENIYVLALAKARSIQEPGYNMQVIHSSAIAFGLFSHWQPLPQPPKEQ